MLCWPLDRACARLLCGPLDGTGRRLIARALDRALDRALYRAHRWALHHAVRIAWAVIEIGPDVVAAASGGTLFDQVARMLGVACGDGVADARPAAAV